MSTIVTLIILCAAAVSVVTLAGLAWALLLLVAYFVAALIGAAFEAIESLICQGLDKS